MINEEWLKSLQPGSEVIVVPHYLEKYISVVKRITPTGRIVLKNEKTFGYDGFELGNSWNRSMLEEPTDSTKKEIIRRKLINTLNTTKFSNYSDSALRQIYNILKMEKLNGQKTDR